MSIARIPNISYLCYWLNEIVVKCAAVITRSSIKWYYIQYISDWIRIYIRINTHKRHLISRPDGRAMGCFCEEFGKNDRGITAPHYITLQRRALLNLIAEWYICWPRHRFCNVSGPRFNMSRVSRDLVLCVITWSSHCLYISFISVASCWLISLVFHIRASYRPSSPLFHDNHASHFRDTIWPWKFKVQDKVKGIPVSAASSWLISLVFHIRHPIDSRPFCSMIIWPPIPKIQFDLENSRSKVMVNSTLISVASSWFISFFTSIGTTILKIWQMKCSDGENRFKILRRKSLKNSFKI